MNVKCKACQNVFAFKSQYVKQRKRKAENGEEIIQVYFICPKCGKEYICFYDSAVTQKIKKQISELSRLYKLENNEQKKTKYAERLQQLRVMCKIQSDIARSIFERLNQAE